MTESEEQTAKQESKISTSKQEGIITRQQWLNRSSFHYGDVVMAWTSRSGKNGNSKPWIARIEFVSGELCSTREQKHYPWEGNIKGDQEYDHDFRYLPDPEKNYKLSGGPSSFMEHMKFNG